MKISSGGTGILPVQHRLEACATNPLMQSSPLSMRLICVKNLPESSTFQP
jgi:hypothetical protein